MAAQRGVLDGDEHRRRAWPQAFSTRNASSPGRASTAGWCRRRPWRSTCASAWPTASRCSGCRCRKALGIKESIKCGLPEDMSFFAGAVRHQLRLAASPRWAGCTRCSSSSSAARPRSGAAGSNAPARARPASCRRVCWCGGMLISALGIHLHQFWLMILGSGVIGGIGLGPGLHLAGQHADQVVPRPARHGDRHGDHGLRRRRDDRLAAGGRPDEALRHARPTSA